jgi:hypothetical protein
MHARPSAVAFSTERLEQEVLGLPWRVLLSAPLVATPSGADPLHPAMHVAIPFLGTWSGWLTLQCDARIVHEVATRLYEKELVCAADLDDAARWVATAIAQALHPVIDPSATLGAPVALEAAAPWSPRSCRLAARVRLSSGDRRIVIALHERVPIAVRSTGAFPSDLESALEVPALDAGGERGEDV